MTRGQRQARASKSPAIKLSNDAMLSQENGKCKFMLPAMVLALHKPKLLEISVKHKESVWTDGQRIQAEQCGIRGVKPERGAHPDPRTPTIVEFALDTSQF